MCSWSSSHAHVIPYHVIYLVLIFKLLALVEQGERYCKNISDGHFKIMLKLKSHLSLIILSLLIKFIPQSYLFSHYAQIFCYHAWLCSSQTGKLLCSNLCRHNVPRLTQDGRHVHGMGKGGSCVKEMSRPFQGFLGKFSKKAFQLMQVAVIQY